MRVHSLLFTYFIASIAMLWAFGSPALAADANGHVTRAQFTTAIAQREPVDSVSGPLYAQPNHTQKLFFFSELRQLEGRQVTHRWLYNGRPMAEITFNVGGPRWRVYSSKNLPDYWTGRWQVQVVTDAGEILHEASIDYADDPALNGLN